MIKIIEIQKDIESGQHFMIWSNGGNRPVSAAVSEADATHILNNNFDKEFTDSLEEWIFREETNFNSLAKRMHDFVLIHTNKPEIAAQAVAIIEAAHIQQEISDMNNGSVEEVKKEDILKFLGL